MIRYRLAELGSAVKEGVLMLRAARDVEAAAPSLLQLLAHAAESECATYWGFDWKRLRLRSTATWSRMGLATSRLGGEVQSCMASLNLSRAGHVWRCRKPLWTSAIPATELLAASGGHPQAGLWFAIKSDTSMYGVVELIGRAVDRTTPQNLFVVERLGFRLGQALEDWQ